jgi:hypothetical protein
VTAHRMLPLGIIRRASNVCPLDARFAAASPRLRRQSSRRRWTVQTGVVVRSRLVALDRPNRCRGALVPRRVGPSKPVPWCTRASSPCWASRCGSRPSQPVMRLRYDWSVDGPDRADESVRTGAVAPLARRLDRPRRVWAPLLKLAALERLYSCRAVAQTVGGASRLIWWRWFVWRAGDSHGHAL